MTRQKTAKPGDYVQIPLDDGSFGYGKVLGGEIAFLDLRTSTSEITPERLNESETLFRIWVMEYALKPRSPWIVVGHAELTPEEQESSKFFKKDALNGKLSIYHKGEQYPNRYIEYPATYEECVGLERAAVWNPEHVESRLLDHFRGQKNIWVEQLSLKPSD